MPRYAPILFFLAGIGCSGDGAPTSPTPAPTIPTFQIAGTVRDASANIPIAGVMLAAMDGPNVGKSAPTAPDGRYTLKELESGTFTLRAQHSGYEDHLQQVSITSHTTIDIRLIPRRSVNSGWVGGGFFATADDERIGNRVTTAQVTQNGINVSGQFGTAEGTSGTFTGYLTGTQFTGTLRGEIVYGSPTRRCRASTINLTGSATPDYIDLAAPSLALENCTGSITDVSLTLHP